MVVQLSLEIDHYTGARQEDSVFTSSMEYHLSSFGLGMDVSVYECVWIMSKTRDTPAQNIKGDRCQVEIEPPGMRKGQAEVM